MQKYKVPKLETRIICVASHESDPTLLASVSSYSNDLNVYLPVFSFPKLGTFCKDKEKVDFQEDKFISHIIGRETQVLINNALARVNFGKNSEKLLLVGLDEMQKSYFSFLPPSLKIEIDNLDEVDEKLQFLGKKFDGEIICKRSDVIDGLILAKQQNKRIFINEEATQLTSPSIYNKAGIVIIESNHSINDIIAINYALSVDADVILIKPIERQEVHGLQEYIYEWKRNNSTKAYKKISKKIRKRIGYSINFAKYKYATFFTQGLPYGLILKNIIPISHILKGLREDFLIFNTILRENLGNAFDSAIVFSPEPEDLGELAEVEARYTIDILEKNNFLVKKLIKEGATVDKFDKYGSHYPYDLLHICSHGGQTDGYYVVEKFIDRNGQEHVVEYEEVVGFSPGGKDMISGKDMVKVFSKAIFRKFDGLKWMSPELKAKHFPDYVFEDMRKALFNDEKDKKTSRVYINRPIYGSCHIRCYDSIHQGEFHAIGSHGCPFIFNNTCSSWLEIAVTIIAAGSRAYIGTLWNIRNDTAVQSAKIFYEKFLDENLIDAFYRMTKSIQNPIDADIYIFWGLHISTIQRPEKFTKRKVLLELINSFFRWKQYAQKIEVPELKRNSFEAAMFIQREIKTNFRPEDLGNFKKDFEKDSQYLTREMESSKFTDNWVSRGVIDLPKEG